MSNQDCIPHDDLGLTAPQVAAQPADATWFRYVLNHTGVIRDSGSQWVD
jgi:hypothetical protein